MEDPASHLDPLFGDSFTDPDTEPCVRRDTEVESVRSHLSSHPDQMLLPHSLPAFPSRSQTQRLQRRRNQYYYVDGVLVPAPPPPPCTHQSHRSGAERPAPPRTTANQTPLHKRAKSYGSSGTTSSWLLGSSGAFADARRQPWNGERREVRKLQKDHPVGSARPSFTVAIGNDDGTSSGAPEVTTERDEAKGSVLGVRRRMERLKGLYRRGSKEAVLSPNPR